jgi:hypothetical protein
MGTETMTMEFVKELNPIIISGLWNNAIFNQEWVGKYLLPGEDLQIEYPLHGNGSVRSSTDTLRVCAIDNKLFFTILDYQDSTLQKIEQLAVKISDYLPHTPVTDMGFNFDFRTSLNEKLLQCINLSDIESFSEDGLTLTRKILMRSFKKDNYVLTVNIEYFDDECIVRLNYNFSISALTEIKSILSEGVLLNFKKLSIELLDRIYDLKLS